MLLFATLTSKNRQFRVINKQATKTYKKGKMSSKGLRYHLSGISQMYRFINIINIHFDKYLLKQISTQKYLLRHFQRFMKYVCETCGYTDFLSCGL